MRRNLILHPLWFSVFPILFLYSNNIREASLSDIVLPIILAAAAAAAAWFVLTAVYKHPQKAAVLVSLGLLFFFCHGPVFDAVFCRRLGPFVLDRNRYLMLIWAVLWLVAAAYLMLTRRNIGSVTQLLNFIGAVLVGMSLLNIIVYSASNPEVRTMDEIRKDGWSAKPPLRDVYYVILDGHARNSTLKELYGYDNQPFIDELRKRGFYVPDLARSNYGNTYLSLSSSLNMTHLHELSRSPGVRSRDKRPAYRMIEFNRVVRLFKSFGYRYVHFSSGAGATDRSRLADDYRLKDRAMNEFRGVLLQSTMLRPWERAIIGDDMRARVQGEFDGLGDLAVEPGPKFVFTHIVSPHPPFVFDRDGGKVPDAPTTLDGDIWARRDLYLGQLIYADRQILKAIDRILAASPLPPIIIIQGDHGPYSTFRRLDVEGWRHPRPDMLRELFSIFEAVHMPGIDPKALYPSMTPVNTFRIVFNEYFGARLALLEDHSLYSTDEYPYDFQDVTDTLDEEERRHAP